MQSILKKMIFFNSHKKLRRIKRSKKMDIMLPYYVDDMKDNHYMIYLFTNGAPKYRTYKRKGKYKYETFSKHKFVIMRGGRTHWNEHSFRMTQGNGKFLVYDELDNLELDPEDKIFPYFILWMLISIMIMLYVLLKLIFFV